MAQKRFYWLKLHNDFFTSKRMKKLRKMAGGDTYLIIYLKLQLLAINSEGILEWTGLEDNFAAELALDIDEAPEDVEVTLMFLLANGLAETMDKTHIYFPYAVENTGSEGASAHRVREYRERKIKANALPGNGDVTQVKRIGNGEIDIEKEKEIEIDKEKDKRTKGVDALVKKYGIGEKLTETLREFASMRKLMKKPMTDYAMELLIKKLRKMSPDEGQQVEIVNQSIREGWLGVYPIKTETAVGPNGVRVSTEKSDDLDKVF